MFLRGYMFRKLSLNAGNVSQNVTARDIVVSYLIGTFRVHTVWTRYWSDQPISVLLLRWQIFNPRFVNPYGSPSARKCKLLWSRGRLEVTELRQQATTTAGVVVSQALMRSMPIRSLYEKIKIWLAVQIYQKIIDRGWRKIRDILLQARFEALLLPQLHDQVRPYKHLLGHLSIFLICRLDTLEFKDLLKANGKS